MLDWSKAFEKRCIERHVFVILVNWMTPQTTVILKRCKGARALTGYGRNDSDIPEPQIRTLYHRYGGVLGADQLHSAEHLVSYFKNHIMHGYSKVSRKWWPQKGSRSCVWYWTATCRNTAEISATQSVDPPPVGGGETRTLLKRWCASNARTLNKHCGTCQGFDNNKGYRSLCKLRLSMEVSGYKNSIENVLLKHVQNELGTRWRWVGKQYIVPSLLRGIQRVRKKVL